MKTSLLARRPFLLPLAVCALFLSLSVGSGSLWLDEGITWSVVGGSFRDFLHAVFGRADGVSSMPLWFFAQFAWCKLFGLSEYAMRSLNFLFAAWALWGAAALVRETRLPAWSLLLFGANPVLVYYMGEARPYVALYAAGLWSWFALVRLSRDPSPRRLAAFLAAFWIAFACHLMAAFMAIPALLLLLPCWSARPGLFRSHLRVALAFSPLFLALAALYVQLVSGSPEVRNTQASPAAGLLSIAYYFAGFGGLGWPRNALRAHQFACSPRMAVELSLAVFAWLALAFQFFRRRLYHLPGIAFLAVALAAASLAFVAVNVAAHIRFWERHLVWLLPGFLLFLAIVLKSLVALRHTLPVRALVAFFLALQLLSAFHVLSLPLYRNDDYRSAARLALAAPAVHVFFEGDPVTFLYYGFRGPWGHDLDPAASPLPPRVNISKCSRADVDSLLSRASGPVAFLLSEKPEFDAPGLYPSLPPSAVRVRSFAFFTMPDVLPEAP